MELRPSQETASRWATKKCPNILWNWNVYYLIHKSLPQVPLLSEMNSVHAIKSYFPKIHFNIILPGTLGLPSGLFPSGFPTKVLY
jgi:hypothetical protein